MRHFFSWSVLSLLVVVAIGCGAGEQTHATGTGGAPHSDAGTSSGGGATGGGPAIGGDAGDGGDGGPTDSGDGGPADSGDGGPTDSGDGGPTDSGDGGPTDSGDGGPADSGDAGPGDAGDGGPGDPCSPDPCAAQNQACQAVGGQAVCFTPSCDDANPCTADTVVMGACVHTPVANGTACSTSACLAGQACAAGACAGGAATSCDDGDPCTQDACAAATGCTHTPVAAGTPCNDGIACTVGDACSAQGACAGTVTGACSATSCAATTPLGGTIDIPVAETTATVTLGGQPLPASDVIGAQIQVYLVSHDTGQWHTFATFGYNNNLFGPTVAPRMVAGVYDLYYCHGCELPGDGGIAFETNPADPFPLGLRVLRSDVVVGAGKTALAIDIPVTQTTSTITLGGQPLPASDPIGAQIQVYLVSHDTGQWHTFATFGYNNNLFGPTVAPRVIPGTYDVYYCHGCELPGSGGIAFETNPADPFPLGLRVLQSNVVVAGASANLNVDIPVTKTTSTITLGGQPLPASDVIGAQIQVYLVSHDTGQWHTFATFGYNNNLFGPTVAPRVIPGVYDIYYCHGCELPGSGGIAFETNPADPFPLGLRVLQSNVVVAGASANLNVDIPVTQTTGTITLGGQPLPASDPIGAQIQLYLVSHDTGQWHTFATFGYNNNLFGPTVAPRVIPGTYDVYYCHGCELPGDGGIAFETNPADPFPLGLRVLQSNVVVAGASANLNVDIPVTQTTSTITLGGQPLPASDVIGAQIQVYLVSHDTGQWHTFATFGYNNNLFGPTVAPRVIPGTYDVYYCHGCELPGSGGIAFETNPADPFPLGLRVLQSNVVVAGASANLNVDIPVAPVAEVITLAEQPLPASDAIGAQVQMYLVSRDTGQWHTLATFGYNNNLFGPTVAPRVIPGTYDVYYCHGCELPGSGGIAFETNPADPLPLGLRILDACVTVP